MKKSNLQCIYQPTKSEIFTDRGIYTNDSSEAFKTAQLLSSNSLKYSNVVGDVKLNTAM